MLSSDQHFAPLYRRSPIQVAVLLLLTAGLYTFYWAYKVRRWCEVTLELPNNSTWKTIALVIPLFNLFLLYDLGLQIKAALSRAEIAVGAGAAMLGVLAFFVGMMYRLHSPYWVIGFFDVVPLTIMYFYFERAQFAISGVTAAPQRFTPFEWMIVGLGALLWLMVLIGYALPNADGSPPANPAFFYGGIALLALVLAGIKIQSDKLLRTLPTQNSLQIEHDAAAIPRVSR